MPSHRLNLVQLLNLFQLLKPGRRLIPEHHQRTGALAGLAHHQARVLPVKPEGPWPRPYGHGLEHREAETVQPAR